MDQFSEKAGGSIRGRESHPQRGARAHQLAAGRIDWLWLEDFHSKISDGIGGRWGLTAATSFGRHLDCESPGGMRQEKGINDVLMKRLRLEDCRELSLGDGRWTLDVDSRFVGYLEFYQI